MYIFTYWNIKYPLYLTNWELLYRGSATSSHATIAKKQGSYVPVLLWSIEPEDEKRLDIYEGYPRYYYKQNVMVDIDGKKKRAMVYTLYPLFCLHNSMALF